MEYYYSYQRKSIPQKRNRVFERGSDILILSKQFTDDFTKGNKLGITVFSKDAKGK